MRVFAALGLAVFVWPAVAGLGVMPYMLIGMAMGRETLRFFDGLVLFGFFAASACFCIYLYRRLEAAERRRHAGMRGLADVEGAD